MELGEIIEIIQAGIAFGAILATFIVFDFQKKQRRKEAAIMIFLQIESMKQNIRTVSSAILQNGNFNIEKMWRAQKIFVDNAWDEERKHLIRKLSKEEILAINKFYNEANTINRQICAVQDVIQAINSDFYIGNKMCEHLAEETKPKYRVDAMYTVVLENCCNTCLEFYDLLPLRKLKKIAKIKF